MREADISLKNNRILILLIIGIVFVCFSVRVNSRENQIQSVDRVQQSSGPDGDAKIRVSAKEIRFDAVVLDKSGHQAIDLKSADFDIYQDNKKQTVNSCTYIAHRPIHLAVPTHVSKGSKTESMIASSGLSGVDTRRKIVFFPNYPAMTLKQSHETQMFIKKFIEDEMQEGDLVAITMNPQGDTESQIFSSDKAFVLSVLTQGKWWSGPQQNMEGYGLPLSNCIRKLQNIPGRKSLIVISPEPAYLAGYVYQVISPELLEKMHEVPADAAFRAGVVIHIIDISEPKKLDAIDHTFSSAGSISAAEEANMIRHELARKSAESQFPLAKRTGGLLAKNLSAKTMENIKEQLGGYYLLTYTPEESTFTPPPDLSRRPPYRKIKIKVKRSGMEVYARDGFFGVPSRENTVTGK